jgi:hypothetical protein
VTVAESAALLLVIMLVGGTCVIATEMRGVWELEFVVACELVVHPDITATAAKLHKLARSAAMRSLYRPFRSILTPHAGTLATKAVRISDSKLRSLQCG